MKFLYKSAFPEIDSQLPLDKKQINTYNLNNGYWYKWLKKDFAAGLEIIHLVNQYDWNPIFIGKHSTTNKIVRIIQQNPNEWERGMKLCQYWHDTIYLNDEYLSELVISVFLTPQTRKLCCILVKKWFTLNTNVSNNNLSAENIHLKNNFYKNRKI